MPVKTTGTKKVRRRITQWRADCVMASRFNISAAKTNKRPRSSFHRHMLHQGVGRVRIANPRQQIMQVLKHLLVPKISLERRPK